MVMPAQLLSGGELVLYGHQFGASLQVVGQIHAVPTLAGAYQFGTFYLLRAIILLSISFLATHNKDYCTANEGNGHYPKHNLVHGFHITLRIHFPF